MILNQASLQGVYVGFNTLFNEVFADAKPRWPRLAIEVPSSTKSEEYKWLGKFPKMREWIGERQIQNLGTHSHTIKNKDWEATISVDRNDVEDDTIGVYRPMVRALADAAAYHPDEMVLGLLALGFTELCYDGQPFFDGEHPDGPNEGTQSNKGTKKLSAASYAEARTAMMSLMDEKGKPLGAVPDLLVVSPKNEKAGLEILKAERDANGATNVYQGSAELLVLPELAGMPEQWFLLDTRKPVKPFVFQERKKPEFVAKDKIDDDNVFKNKEFLFGVDSRDNVGYALWQLAWGSNGTV
jgi:phage major head subunit gpT-like protein